MIRIKSRDIIATFTDNVEALWAAEELVCLKSFAFVAFVTESLRQRGKVGR